MRLTRTRGLSTSTALSFLCVALGCSEGQSSTGSGGGADAGPTCTWDGTGGGVAIPDCSAYHFAVNLVGTVDGKHYDNLLTDNIYTTAIPDTMSPQTLNMPLPAGGSLHLEWPRPTVWGQWIAVTGTLQLPLDKAPRAVLPGSKVRLKCRESQYQYILTIDGGELTGCSIN